MKKLKSTLLLLLSCLFVSVFAFTGCTDTNKDSSGSDSTDTSSSSGGSSSSVEEGGITEFSSSAVLQSISVDTSSAKTGFSVGETFSYSGLVVEATAIEDSVEYTLEVTDYEIDYSEYDSGKVGEYTIYISYSVPETTAEKYANYTVTVSSVLPAYANIDAVYTGDQQLTYSTEGVTIDLSSDKLTVTSHIGDDATNLTDTVVTDYELVYYVNGGEEKEVEGTSITATEAGVYSIYVKKDYVVGTETMPMSAQILVCVVDTPTTLVKNEGGTTSYDYGATTIGSDWTYTLSYASGKTEQLAYSDVTITADSSTSGSQDAVVTYAYSYTGVKDGEVTTVSDTLTVSVAITVAEAQFGTTVGFLTAALDSVDDFSSVSYSAGSTIATNDLFTLVSTLATKTSIGTDSNSNYLLQVMKNGEYTFSFTDMDDNNFAPDQGIKLSSAISGATTSAPSVDSGTAFTLTATKACKVQLYLTLANDSYNSNRTGTIYYAVNGGTAVSESVSNRTTAVTITVTLAAGDVLTIGATNTHSSSAKLWLFGAQGQEIS